MYANQQAVLGLATFNIENDMNQPKFPLTSANLNLYPQSNFSCDQYEIALTETNNGRNLAILMDSADPLQFIVNGNATPLGNRHLFFGPLNHHNLKILRNDFPWLNPSLLGLRTSVGMGDRIGLATPGHVRAVRATGSQVAPIFAQQSIREMWRTQRTPDNVMDDAIWGILQEGWQEQAGADADHLKTPQDIDACLEAGYTFFTVDPGDHVHNINLKTSRSELAQLIENLPPHLQINQTHLLNKRFTIEGYKISFDETTLMMAMAKYGQAINHVIKMYLHLASASNGRPFEFEISVDETELPTTHAEHFYIASELNRAGVKWVSLAPRYVGRFEKGVDYIGDLVEFEQDIAGHAAIAREHGPYKLSLHSGSDKYRIYAIAMQQTEGLVHLKTAGTSYLEALHTIAELDTNLLKEIYEFARLRYPHDQKTYHVSALLEKAPLPDQVTNWVELIQQFDAREVLHVTFGSVLTERKADNTSLFFDRITELLKKNPQEYAKNLEAHFIRHLAPFSISL